MKVSNRVFYFGAGLVTLALVAVPAIASHGKAGLWNVTITANVSGAAMPNMSQLPPQAQAAMRARGITMNGNSMTVQHCMTQAEVDANGPPPMRNQRECTMTNVRTGGGSFSADMTCNGQMTGTGHVEVTYDSREHYVGKSTLTGTAQGQPVSTSSTFEGRWAGADCKGVTH
jgi:hypothetical protein